MKLTYTKSWARNLLMLDFTFGPCLLLVLQVCNVKPSHRKSFAGNILCSALTLGPSFKVK